MLRTRILVVLLLLGLAIPVLAEDPPAAGGDDPAPGAAEPPRTGTRPPSSWEPQEDGPPPPAFPPTGVRELGTGGEDARTPVDPFLDEPGVLDDYRVDEDLPSGGQLGGLIPLPEEMPTRTEVVRIQKTHNVVWRCGCPGKALRLDILFAVVGLKGEWVGATVDFYDEKSGRPIMSVHQPFMNRSGQVSAWTKLIPVMHDARWLRTTLVVPYKAFPCPPEQESYGVVGKVSLVKRRECDQYAIVVSGRTRFTVHSTDDAPRDWRDYTGAERAPEIPCSERVDRFLGRPNVLRVIDESPRRAKQLWQPFCRVPGA